MLRKSDLQGYRVKGVLSAKDSFSRVTEILEKWCRASSAKFNVAKTEIIPIGSENYRKSVIETRKLNDTDDPIPDNVHIDAIWTPTIEKIDSALERWGRGHPTLEMRRKICQVTFGSMTQYLTQVNGMPKSVEKQLIKSQREFMWGGKSSSVQRDMLLAPISEGGKNLFDLTARNEAIQIMKLKSYLEMDPALRATWAFVTDERLAMHDRKTSNVAKGSHVNTFTQDWSPKRSDLPPHRTHRRS
ncbi:hypothetical protein DFH06DRAFT_1196761 [Mycena polygramma]|nr:hypothetical protein DFH06DRAFT_1196761 [Mycena polygramma]